MSEATASGRQRSVARVSVVAGLLLLAAVLRLTVFAAEPTLAGITRDPPSQVGGLVFVDHGTTVPRHVELTPPAGGLRLVYFGYLSCPDVCPLTMSDIARARRELTPRQAALTSVAFVTVDPERDDPERMRRYMSTFFDDGWLGLTAPDPAALDEAAARLGVRYAVEPHEPGADRYDVDHSAITYVVDDTGTVVRELPFGVTAAEIAQVIRGLLPT